MLLACVTMEHVPDPNKNTIKIIERDVNESFSVIVATDLRNGVIVKIQALIALTKIPLAFSTV